ncbi:MAG: ABC transporter permease subunit [Archaeoglobaceae archaeon]
MAYKLVLTVLLLLIPPFLGYFATFIALIAILLAILTVSWHFMEKEAGWVSLGHSIPFGISAYLFALNLSLLLLSPLCFLLFLALSFTGRVLFPFATFIASIALWQISHYFVFEGKGGEEGFSISISIPIEILYVAVLIFFLFSLLFVELLSRSNLGLKINATRDDEIASKSVGINPVYFRAISFAFSTILALIAGIFYALIFGHVSPDIFSPFYALFPFIASTLAFNKRWACLASSYVIVALSHGLSAIVPEAHYVLYATVLMLFAVVKKNAESM